MLYQTLEEVIKLADYKQHPFGAVWQQFDDATFRELVDNIDRRGLDKDITRYQGMVLEGWHRYLACLATKVAPQFVDFEGDDLAAAELVNASEVRRHSSADQRYASFVMLCEACPAFRDTFEQLAAKGKEQQIAGRPLGTGDKRVNVIETLATAAGVGKTTAKKVERVRKAMPDAIPDIAAGRTTANKVLKKLKKKKKGQTGTKRKVAPTTDEAEKVESTVEEVRPPVLTLNAPETEASFTCKFKVAMGEDELADMFDAGAVLELNLVDGAGTRIPITDFYWKALDCVGS